MDRRALNREGIQGAADLRDQLDLDPFGPVDPYQVAEMLGIKVVFMDTSMEGFYFKQAQPRIILSSLRPMPRRAFTCSHEIGHHWFGHGSTIDQLQLDERSESDKPDEVLANAFAAALLMPTVGVRGAFNRRGWSTSQPTPLQLFTVACQFGVGYMTLLNHMTYLTRDISTADRATLAKSSPQRIRNELIGEGFESLVVIDEKNEAAAFEIEASGAAIVPRGTSVDGNALAYVRSYPNFDLYAAARRGISKVADAGDAFEIRVMPDQYVGPAANRFLEDPDED
jgi:Zn-dependent peptidase ImmA (M78 family)